MNKLAAWAVHFFTASGLVAGFLGLLAVTAGDYREAMFWILVTLVIDGIDGTFARLARVEEVLPEVDGKAIDYVIDFFTYVILPAYLFYAAVDMPEWPKLLSCFAMLLSSAVYYGKAGMVSADGRHFVGYPALWNMFVYFFVFVVPDLGPGPVHLLVLAFAVLHFVPVLFAYPSRGGRWWRLTILNTVIFILAAVMNVWYYPEASPFWRGAALVTTSYYALLAAVDTWSARTQVQ